MCGLERSLWLQSQGQARRLVPRLEKPSRPRGPRPRMATGEGWLAGDGGRERIGQGLASLCPAQVRCSINLYCTVE